MAQSAPSPYAAHGGHTLVELLMVLMIVAIAAAIVLPGADPVVPSALDVAVGEVAQALRFAQSDAIRTGSYRVVRIDVTDNSVRVFALDMAATPPVEDTAHPLSHPVDKKKYEFDFAQGAATAGVTVTSSVFTFADGSSASQLGFGADGSPVNVLGPNPQGLVGTGLVQLAYGAFQRTVSVDAATGRVTLSS